MLAVNVTGIVVGTIIGTLVNAMGLTYIMIGAIVRSMSDAVGLAHLMVRASRPLWALPGLRSDRLTDGGATSGQRQPPDNGLHHRGRRAQPGAVGVLRSGPR